MKKEQRKAKLVDLKKQLKAVAARYAVAQRKYKKYRAEFSGLEAKQRPVIRMIESTAEKIASGIYKSMYAKIAAIRKPLRAVDRQTSRAWKTAQALQDKYNNLYLLIQNLNRKTTASTVESRITGGRPVAIATLTEEEQEKPARPPLTAELIEEIILENDGLCMDNKPERQQLAKRIMDAINSR